jgi:hypothetical protein
MLRIYERAAESLTKYNVGAPEFRGGVSSLPEFMGKRRKRAAALTNTPAPSGTDSGSKTRPSVNVDKAHRAVAVAQL